MKETEKGVGLLSMLIAEAFLVDGPYAIYV